MHIIFKLNPNLTIILKDSKIFIIFYFQYLLNQVYFILVNQNFIKVSL